LAILVATPVTELEEEEEEDPELPEEPDDAVLDAMDPEDVAVEPPEVPEAEGEDAAATNGLLSLESEACVRSNVNCVISLDPCCAIVADVDVVSSAEPVFQAAIQGLLAELAAESN